MLLLLILTIFLIIPTPGLAQGPGFDPDCYFPRVGVAGEIDTICGSQKDQELGDNLQGIGGRMDYPFQSVVVKGMPRAIPFMTEIEGGPDLTLAKLRNANKPSKLHPSAHIIKRGPFSRPGSNDAFVLHGGAIPYIYWADSNGELSELRRTQLVPSIRGTRSTFYETTLAYATFLTSDSIMDVVIDISVNNGTSSAPSRANHLMLFKASSALLLQEDTAWEDESVFVDSVGGWGYSSQGDWRGIGRDDLILARNSHGFYFRNDPPFDLRELVRTLKSDTLWSGDEHRVASDNLSILGNTTSMRAFPKAEWDKSVDYLPFIPIQGQEATDLRLYRGGPNFGKERLRIDSPDYLIRHPFNQGITGATWGPGLQNCGDMTGTGNLVIAIGGRSWGSGIDGLNFFYVTGKALDDKIDMFYRDGFFSGGPSDSITADNDLLQDNIMGSPMFKESIGTIHVLHGSTKIPVRINPDMSVVHRAPNRGSALPYTLSSAGDRAFFALGVLEGEPATIQVRDILGRLIFSDHAVSFQSTYELNLASFGSGTYQITLRTTDQLLTAKLSIVR